MPRVDLRTNLAVSDHLRARQTFLWDPSLALYLPLTELGGNTFQSKDANKHSCTVTGTLLTNHGRYFDGTDDVITIPASTPINNLAAMTLIAWINPTTLGENSRARIFDKANNDNVSIAGWEWQLNTNYYLDFVTKFSTTRLAVSTANNTITLGIWQFLALTWDGSVTATNVHVYKNNAEVSYQTQTNGVGTRPSDSAYNLLIGDSPGSIRCFNGKIGDSWIYNRILTTSELIRIHQNTKWRYE